MVLELQIMGSLDSKDAKFQNVSMQRKAVTDHLRTEVGVEGQHPGFQLLRQMRQIQHLITPACAQVCLVVWVVALACAMSLTVEALPINTQDIMHWQALHVHSLFIAVEAIGVCLNPAQEQ